MIGKNFLKEKLANGEKVIGTWSIIPSVSTIDVICSAGLDFIMIDSEHGPIDPIIAQEMIIACESRQVSPIVRTSGLNASEILKFLDVGAHGIQIPNITNIDEVKKFIEYSKYPPEGNRGFSPFTRSGDYIPNDILKYTENQNKEIILGINIEGKESINNIDNMFNLKAVDLYFIGLYDLSKSLGIPGDVKNKKVLIELEKLIKKIKSKGKFAGTIVTDDNDIKYFLDIGIDFLLNHVDAAVLKKAYYSSVDKFCKYK